MGGWNYRIVRHRDPLPKWLLKKKNKEHREKYYPNGYIEWFGIHELFYKKNGEPFLVTEEPIKVTTDEFSKEEFNRVLKWMRQSVERPVLDFKTLKEVENETSKLSNRIHKKSNKGKRV